MTIGTCPVGPEVLVGRAAECAMLDKLATDVRDGFSGSLVFIGEPGVGKTRLLQYRGGLGRRCQSTLWIAGAQSELRLGFAALHRLLTALSRSPRQAGQPASRLRWR